MTTITIPPAAPYDFDAAAITAFCARHDIPVGEPIPAAAWALIRSGTEVVHSFIAIVMVVRDAALVAEGCRLIAAGLVVDRRAA